ncbi:acyl-CoA synthetase [Neoroseomonas soli]|uniref:Acyl-CoA synthetase n=1 Tax=Neoroseomonas soli TaxID=1081025 RepID=A0A9X9WR34_9PROT|nr:acyl-CoA synthetase [Neoroseomonas soli]MBR0669613.1 acyl-CoA synthetase [Neoroseomonas soli]
MSEAAAIWAGIVGELGWTGRPAVNLAETLVDRHATSARVALHWEGRDGTQRAFTFAELSEASARHADMLRSLGITAGDRVACILPRVPEAIVAMLGAFRIGAIHLPIFSGFGAEATARRVSDAGARVVVTHADVRARLPQIWPYPVTVVTVPRADGTGVPAGDVDHRAALAAASADVPPVLRLRTDPAVLLFTSGSTGPPKAVAIATNFPAAIWPAICYAGDLRSGDVFWPTGDPGWGYGLVCYAVALAAGEAVHMWEANPTPETTLGFLARHRITVLGTVPTLLRGLMALGEGSVRRPDIAVRSIMSCGEPLNAECVTFFRRVWGVTPLDQFGSSEHGLPIGNRFVDRDAVRPGSMGKPLPGQRIAIVDEAGAVQPGGTPGLIATMPPPDGIYALGYWNNPEAEAALRRQGWIVTGDIGHEDADGYYWFEGRMDDVIKSAGYRVGPFEVESALLTHSAVAEAAVIGKPDAARGQLVKAFVVLKPGFADSQALREELVSAARREVGAHAFPREIEIVTDLPKTTTGKIQRFVLRQQEVASQTGSRTP